MSDSNINKNRENKSVPYRPKDGHWQEGGKNTKPDRMPPGAKSYKRERGVKPSDPPPGNNKPRRR